MLNTVTINSQTYTRKGRRYTHAVAFIRHDGTVDHVEWATRLELAERNHAGHVSRWRRALAGEDLPYPWSSDGYRGFADILMVPVRSE